MDTTEVVFLGWGWFFWSTLFMDKQLVIDFSEAVNTNLLTVTEAKQSDATLLSHIKSNLFVQLFVLFICFEK